MTSYTRVIAPLAISTLLLGCGASQQEVDTAASPDDSAASPDSSPATATASPVVATAPPEEPSDPLAAPPDVAAPPADAERTQSGLASRVLRPGSGLAKPSSTSEVTVHYSGWTTDGNLFDSSHQRGQPATFPLDAVIAGWTEGLQLMVVGERRRFWIPEDLAYGGRAGSPQGMLIFDVELLSFNP